MMPQRLLRATGHRLPNRSLDFESGSSNFLNLDSSVFSGLSRSAIGVSAWVLRESTGTQQTIFAIGRKGASNWMLNLEFTSGNKIRFSGSVNGSATAIEALTTATYTSTSAFYHIYCLYSASAGAGDRVRVFVNGTEVTAFDTMTESTSNLYDPEANNLSMSWGNDIAAVYYDGLLFQPCIFSGTLAGITSLITGGRPQDVRFISGLWSLLQTTAGSTINQDYVTGFLWDDNSASNPAKSTIVP